MPGPSWSRTGLLDREDNGPAMRIVSLQPSATEILFALGLGEWLVGRSHRCDHPEEVFDVPVVTSAGPMTGSPAFGADDGRVDLKLLAALEPDLVLTAPGCGAAFEAQAVRDGLRARGLETSVVGLDPRSLEGIFNSISTVGAFVEAEDEAIGLVELLREQLGRLENGVLERRLEGIASRRTIILESLDPPVGAGLWVPELVRRAGGWELLGREGEDPEMTSWARIREVEPEVLVLALRGYDAPAAARLCQTTSLPTWFDELEAVREGACYAVDGEGLILRPGPRIIEAIAVLAELLDPEGFSAAGSPDAWIPLGPLRIGPD
jgi:iron complex transport system substrate-binding protein